MKAPAMHLKRETHMTRFLAVAIFAVLSIIAPVHAETLLHIDYGWRSDGKVGCLPGFLENAPSWLLAACADPIGDLENFVQIMDTKFSSIPSCHGVTLVRFPWGPLPLVTAAEILKRPHWMFFIVGYDPGSEKQSWKLLDPSKKSVFGGQGRPNEIVQEVCGVITGAGGSMLQQ